LSRLVRTAPFLLVLLDVSQHCARRVPPLVEIEVFERPGDHRLLVVGVVNHEVRLNPDRGSVYAQKPRARRVKRPHPERPRELAPAQALEPTPHLAGRLVREGDRQNPPWGYAHRRQQSGDSIGDDPRLSASGSCKDEERPSIVSYRRRLRLVEVRVEHHCAT
jgi:hypothetical protein